MESKYITFKELIKNYKLDEVNYTYLNRKSLNLLSNCDSNIKLRVGEKYILWLLKLFKITNLNNIDNFDNSGFARDFFNICEKNKFNIAIYGGEVSEVFHFKNKISNEFKLNIVDFASGYLDYEFYIERIKITKPNIILIGLGNPRQNILLSKLSKLSIKGVYTCGAFITQESKVINDYYENKKLPRWVIRSLNEEGHFRRVIWTSLTSIITIIRYKFLK